MADNFGTQLKSLAALPGQIIRSGLAAGKAYDMKKKLKVKQNQNNPSYGKIVNRFGKPIYR